MRCIPTAQIVLLVAKEVIGCFIKVLSRKWLIWVWSMWWKFVTLLV